MFTKHLTHNPITSRKYKYYFLSLMFSLSLSLSLLFFSCWNWLYSSYRKVVFIHARISCISLSSFSNFLLPNNIMVFLFFSPQKNYMLHSFYWVAWPSPTISHLKTNINLSSHLYQCSNLLQFFLEKPLHARESRLGLKLLHV